MDDVPVSPLALAMACAMLIDPELAAQAQANGPISLPEIRRSEDWLLPPLAGQTDSLGNALRQPAPAGGSYTWTERGLMSLPEDPRPGWLAHENGHHLQNLANMSPGAAGSEQRAKIEAQAYAIEDRTRFECLDWRGNWDEKKLAPYLMGIEGKP